MNLFDPDLYREVRKPLDEAADLPPACYHDEAFYQREMQRIFERGWVMVGRVERAANPGDWFTVAFGRCRLVITRDEHGDLPALANACRHRGAPLVEGEGN